MISKIRAWWKNHQEIKRQKNATKAMHKAAQQAIGDAFRQYLKAAMPVAYIQCEQKFKELDILSLYQNGDTVHCSYTVVDELNNKTYVGKGEAK